MNKRKKVKITLYSYLNDDTLNKLMEKMLWDSEYSYVLEDCEWKINK
jgi:hypothetical protein